MAEEAIVIPDRSEGKLELHLRNGSVHEFSAADPGHYTLSAFGERDLTVEVKSAEGEHVARARNSGAHHERLVARKQNATGRQR